MLISVEHKIVTIPGQDEVAVPGGYVVFSSEFSIDILSNHMS